MKAMNSGIIENVASKDKQLVASLSLLDTASSYKATDAASVIYGKRKTRRTGETVKIRSRRKERMSKKYG